MKLLISISNKRTARNLFIDKFILTFILNIENVQDINNKKRK